MSDERATWSALMDWLMDLFAMAPGLQSKLPKIEAKDNHEPTSESLREEARKIDAMPQSNPPKKPVFRDGKSLDKEFWETMQ